MTIHSISIAPCSLSISRGLINWPPFFLSFLFDGFSLSLLFWLTFLVQRTRCSIGHVFCMLVSKFFQSHHRSRFHCIICMFLRVICADGKILSAVKPFHLELLLTALRTVFRTWKMSFILARPVFKGCYRHKGSDATAANLYLPNGKIYKENNNNNNIDKELCIPKIERYLNK